MKTITLFGILCFVAMLGKAQDSKSTSPYYPWEVGIGIGLSTFGSEFNMNSDARWNTYDHWDSPLDFSYNVFGRRFFGHVLGAEVGASYSGITGEWDENYGFVGREFDTRIGDVTLMSVVNFNNLFSKNKKDRLWYIYGKLGVGMGWLTLEEGQIPADDSDDVEFLVPLGIGASVKLTEQVKVSVSADYKFMHSDQLDGQWETGLSGGNDRGKGVWGSYPTVVGVGVSYSFGGKKYKKIVQQPIPAAIPEKEEVNPDLIAEPEKKVEKPAPAPKVEATTHTHDGAEHTHGNNEHPHIHAKAGWPVNNSYVYGEIPEDNVVYRVQVLATYHRWEDLKKLGEVIAVTDEIFEYVPVKVYRYGVVKIFSSYKEALSFAKVINSTTKVPDAYVVSFIGDKMIY